MVSYWQDGIFTFRYELHSQLGYQLSPCPANVHLQCSAAAQELEDGHWISTARGPPSDIVDASGKFLSTFECCVLADERLKEQLERLEPAFEMKSVADLVPSCMQDQYSQVVSHHLPLKSVYLKGKAEGP